jgi:hypothetical protein
VRVMKVATPVTSEVTRSFLCRIRASRWGRFSLTAYVSSGCFGTVQVLLTHLFIRGLHDRTSYANFACHICVTYAPDSRRMRASHQRIRRKCCAHLPRATRDVTLDPSVPKCIIYTRKKIIYGMNSSWACNCIVLTSSKWFMFEA